MIFNGNFDNTLLQDNNIQDCTYVVEPFLDGSFTSESLPKVVLALSSAAGATRCCCLTRLSAIAGQAVAGFTDLQPTPNLAQQPQPGRGVVGWHKEGSAGWRSDLQSQPEQIPRYPALAGRGAVESDDRPAATDTHL